MARIPESEIERLKRDVSVERLAEARGIRLKRHGADLIGLCPFHEDHQPSLVITPKKNLWHCLGACRAGGSVIDWVMRAEGVSFRHAVELLRSDLFPSGARSFPEGRDLRAGRPEAAGGNQAGGTKGEPTKQSTVRKLPPPIMRQAEDREVLLQVVSYYHQALKESPEALQYLERRGLKSSEMLEHFKLGFANRTLGYRLPNKNRQEGAELRGRLQKLGILRESGHEHFNGSIVIPIFNLEGAVVGMYGRKITPTHSLREGTPIHLYLPGPHCGVWNEAALEFLRDPRLLDRILADFERCGIVGEETNKLVGYLAAVSRHLETPLAVLVQSSSAAGKSSLMDAVLAFVPPEQRVEYSAMTGQSLFYMGERDLKHKVLAIVEQQGAERAAYALKLLQSEGVLTIASTGKDPETGRLITHEYRVEGPVMIFLTSTAIDLDEELLNRCLVLTVNEEREQTQAIHRQQREQQTLEGLLARREREAILTRHRNAQRLLKPLAVVNPYARELSFPDSQTRMRRDHLKYLALIRSLTLLRQYQRPIQRQTHHGKTVEYIESTREDIELAQRLVNEVLVRSLDELPPQTRRLLLLLDERVSQECQQLKMERSDFRFSRRDVRHHTGWNDSQLKKHLHRLEDLEYLIVHRGGRGQSFVYELYFQRDAASGQPVLPGLNGNYEYDAKKSRPGDHLAPSSHPQVTGVARGGHGAASPVFMRVAGDSGRNREKITSGALGENPVVFTPTVVAASAVK